MFFLYTSYHYETCIAEFSVEFPTVCMVARENQCKLRHRARLQGEPHLWSMQDKGLNGEIA
jgi:hypothetical protein